MGKPEFKKQNIGGSVFFKLALPEDLPPAVFAASTRSAKDPGSFCNLINIRTGDIVQAEQVHGNNVALSGKKDLGRTIKGCDALITDEPFVPLMVRTADCVACFIFDTQRPAIGLAHAGWRGSVAGIAQKTLKAMREHFDTEAENCIIAMSPCIGRCCMEVDEKVMAPLRASFPYWKEVASQKNGEKWMLDLPKLNVMQLVEAGVLKENMALSDLCTSCNSDLFHSFRKERAKDRMYSVAMLGAR